MNLIFCENETYVEAMAKFQVDMARESEDMTLDHATVVRGIQAVIQDPGKGRYLLAVEDNNLIGMLLTVPEWSDWRCSTVLWIHSVYIIPKRRGQGIYKQMYLKLKKQVLESDELAGLRLYVEKKNTNAQKVYEKLDMTNEHYFLYEWLK